MRKLSITTLILAAVLMTGCNDEPSRELTKKADSLIEAAQKQRNYNLMLQLADSLENEGGLSTAKAYYWRGYASDKLNQKRMAEFYWNASLARRFSKLKKRYRHLCQECQQTG